MHVTPAETNISSAVISFERSVTCGKPVAFLKVITGVYQHAQFSANTISQDLKGFALIRPGPLAVREML